MADIAPAPPSLGGEPVCSTPSTYRQRERDRGSSSTSGSSSSISVGLVIFAVAHGGSVFMSFQLRGEQITVVVDALLKVGQLAVGPMFLGLVLLIIGGLGAAAGGNLWGEPWIIASIVVFIAVLVVMWAVGSPYYMGLRKSFEERARTAGRLSSRRHWRGRWTRGDRTS